MLKILPLILCLVTFSSHLLGADATVGQSAQKTAIVGGDGLYNAFVDSVGRISTNANVTFPEAIYVHQALLNGASAAMNVNGATVNQNFSYQPASGV